MWKKNKQLYKNVTKDYLELVSIFKKLDPPSTMSHLSKKYGCNRHTVRHIISLIPDSKKQKALSLPLKH